MIHRLQRKFILICAISVLTVLLLVFSLITAFQITSMNRNLDILADSISEGGGKFPSRFTKDPPAPPHKQNLQPNFNFITPETPYATRHFSVFLDQAGNPLKVNTDSIFSVSKEEAVALAQKIAAKGHIRGWESHYRYKYVSTDSGSAIVFVNGSMNLSALMQSLSITALVLLGCGLLVLILIIFFSGRMVKPVAESYDKQKQFITDAGHELKTPLTLILTNLDIAESELGQNEWLSDIRSEGLRMTELVNGLVSLARMDEEKRSLSMTSIPLDELTNEMISAFRPLSEQRNKPILAQIHDNIHVQGDGALLRQLLSILFDNAIKYCDKGGEITVSLTQQKQTVLKVENTYAAIDTVELDRLFDRFYRSDPARSYAGGYGVGLSIARAITEKHHGTITAYKKDHNHIGFKVILK